VKLLVTGGTGFIGSPLCRALARQGHELTVLTRASRSSADPRIRYLAWADPGWPQAIRGIEGAINLAGEPIAAKRWSPAQKTVIRDSRVGTTRRLVDALAALPQKPSVLVSASAVGYYGDRGDEVLDETNAPGRGFLAETCQAWEAQAQRAEPLGVRVVRLRIGVVLAPGGGALAKMAPPFRGFLGGPLGSGRQWLSWIHREDVIGLIAWSLSQPALSGAVNATAPEPATMRAFCRELGRALRRPAWAPVPAPVLRVLLGEMADMLLTGQRVLPAVARRLGYVFRYPDLPRALAASLPRSCPESDLR